MVQGIQRQGPSALRDTERAVLDVGSHGNVGWNQELLAYKDQTEVFTRPIRYGFTVTSLKKDWRAPAHIGVRILFYSLGTWAPRMVRRGGRSVVSVTLGS